MPSYHEKFCQTALAYGHYERLHTNSKYTTQFYMLMPFHSPCGCPSRLCGCTSPFCVAPPAIHPYPPLSQEHGSSNHPPIQFNKIQEQHHNLKLQLWPTDLVWTPLPLKQNQRDTFYSDWRAIMQEKSTDAGKMFKENSVNWTLCSTVCA